MKFVMFIVSVALFGRLALTSDSIDESLTCIVQEIKQLRKNDALQKNYNEKIERLEKHYDEKIESLEKNYGEKIGKLEQNYEKKIASLEQQLKLGKNFKPQSSKLVLLFYQLLRNLKRKDNLFTLSILHLFYHFQLKFRLLSQPV